MFLDPQLWLGCTCNQCTVAAVDVQSTNCVGGCILLIYENSSCVKEILREFAKVLIRISACKEKKKNQSKKEVEEQDADEFRCCG